MIVIILLLGGGLFYVITQNNKFKEVIHNYKQNQEALKDSLVITKNKNGELVYSKSILITEGEKLEEYNVELAKELDKTKGKVTQLTRLIIQYENGPQISENDQVIKYGDNLFGIQWEFIQTYAHDNERIIKGLTKFQYDPKAFTIIPIHTTLTRDYMNFPIVTGLSEKRGIIDAFGTSSMPGIVIKDVNGYQSPDPVKSLSRFSLSTYLGYGLTYSPQHNMVYHGLQVGGGVSYRFKLW